MPQPNTQLSQDRLTEIRSRYSNLKPETGIVALPDSPNTGLSSTGAIIDLTNSQVLGNLTSDNASLGGLPMTAPTTAQSFYEQAMGLLNPTEGVSTSVNAEAMIRENIKKQEDITRGQISGDYEERIRQEKELGVKEVGGETAKATRLAGGLGLDTATAGYIQSVQKGIDDRIKKLESAKTSALATLDTESLTKINESLRKEEENKTKISDALFDKAMKLLSAGISLENLEMNKEEAKLQKDTNYFNIISKLPAGKTYTSPNGITYTGIDTPDPFYSASNLITLSQNLTEGQTQDITDLNTGTKYTIQGMKSATEGYKTIQSTNNLTREVTLTTYDEKGNIINQVSAGKVGSGIKATEDERSTGESANADTTFRNVIGEGGFADINAYRDIRNLWTQNTRRSNADFDNNFSDYLSASDRTKYNIGSATGLKNTPEGDVIGTGATTLKSPYEDG